MSAMPCGRRGERDPPLAYGGDVLLRLSAPASDQGAAGRIGESGKPPQ